MRTHNYKTQFAVEDILDLVRRTPLDNPSTFLVLNGGTGIGKTVAVMTEMRKELETKFGRRQTIAIIESRRLTRDQLEQNYNDYVECFGGIDVYTRTSFQHNKQQEYDWLVVDECHGLFSDASYSEDAEWIANWIKKERQNTKIIFITANDEYFEDLSRKYFPEDYNFIYLFPDFTEYISKTMVREIQFIKTSRTEDVLRTMDYTKKGIIFLRSANEVYNWYNYLLQKGYRVGMAVSLCCETQIAIPEKVARERYRDMLHKLTGAEEEYELRHICEVIDNLRRNEGKEGVRDALRQMRLPDDIDVLLSTDTLQEGASIHTHLDFIVIDGFTEVEVRQKLGRFRGNELGLLYIIFNPSKHKASYQKVLERFKFLERLNQLERAELFGAQMSGKENILYLKKTIVNGEPYYEINEPARLDAQYNYETACRLLNAPANEAQRMFGMYMPVNGEVKYLTYAEDVKPRLMKERIDAIADRFIGVPLKGLKQKEIIQAFIEEDIRNKQRKPIDSFQKVCNILKEYGWELQEKQATKKDILEFQNCLTKVREKYKILVKMKNVPPNERTASI